MSRFEFDAREALKNKSESATLPIPPNLPTREGEEGSGLGRLGTLADETVQIALAWDLYEERAAIREYDGGQSRFDAERDALGDISRALGVPVAIIKSFITETGVRNEN